MTAFDGAAVGASAPTRTTSALRRAHRMVRAVIQTASGPMGVWIALQGVMWGFIHVDGDRQRTIALEAAAKETMTTANVVAQHVRLAVNSVDATLRMARPALQAGASLDDAVAKPATRSDLVRLLERLDAEGRVVETTPKARGDPPGPRIHPLGRPHVEAHKASVSDMLLVDSPAVLRPGGRRSLSFSRQLRSGADVFEGALVGVVDLDALLPPHHAASLPTGAVALLNPARRILARVGRRDLNDAIVQRDVDESTCQAHPPERPPQDAIVCGERVGDLHVVVAARTASVLRPAQSHQRRLSLGASLVTLFSLPLLATSILRRYRLMAAEGALERAQRRASDAARDLRYALDNMSHGLMLLDVRGDIVLSNARARRLLGYPPDASPPRRNDDLVRHVAGLGDAAPALLDALRLDTPLARAICPGPGGRYLDIRTRRLTEGGYVRTFENATRRHHDSLALQKARDAAETASRARGDFLARMSHEIRTPLHAVMGFARLLQERPLDAEAAALLRQVSAASDHLIAVVDDALDLSLVDAGRLRLQAAPFRLADVLERLAPIAATAGEGKPIAFRWSVDPRLPEWLLGDERRLFQILVNLVGNAHKFTQSGEVVTEASLASTSKGAGLRIEVRDTGPGVDLTTVTRLFESFARGPGTEGTPGAGLGLAIVKQLVEMMDGVLEVGCGARGGASFAFVLPLRPAQAPAPPAPASGAPALDVLVADDTPSSRMLAQAMLEARGHRVVAVEDGAAATAARRRASFDLVLLDLQMPIMGGLEAAVRMRAEERDGKRAVIAALTAQAGADETAMIAAAGMDCLLRKPFGPPELDALLSRAAEARSTAQEPKEV